ncbi:MAG: carboxy-S-adenosyl-L-methionine synthase CmoA [Ketobacteraceae bacterium]|nr:carboxy-S-adenosyl-L-methionine synthase CmoA [Ketobacteraceae bacterium]
MSRRKSADDRNTLHPEPDRIYAEPRSHLVDFAFDEQVAQVFPDMIRRSVPGYETIISMLGVFARQYVTDNSCIYDLGCSLGAASLAVRRHVQASGCALIAVDNSEAMVKHCRENIERDHSITSVEVRCEDVQDTVISNASLVTMNFTLQFISPDRRESVLQRIYDGMNPGGALILSEKIIFDDAESQHCHQQWHHGFKRANGYSDLEISQKRQAIENVLLPDSARVHHERLQSLGFSRVEQWFQCFNFVSFVAVK